MKADINTVAEACSVSKTTVSKVFTGKAGVSDKMRKRVLEAARQLNYAPKQVASQETIAVVLEEFAFCDGTSFRMMMLASIMGKMVHSGYLLKIVTPEDVDRLVSSYVKVAILLVNSQTAISMADKFKAMNIPVVSVNEDIEGCFSVCTDHAQGIDLAIEHLKENGHSRISLFVDSGESWGGRMRLAGYEKAVKDGRIEPLEPHVFKYGETTVVEYLNMVRMENSTALIIQGESFINEAVCMLDLLRIKVPEELSIISSEIKGRSRWFIPAHTTIDQNHDELAAKVVDVVKGILDGKKTQPGLSMLPMALIQRNSVKSLK